MPHIEVGGARLRFDDEGRRDGVPLVFIHGWTADRHRWDHQMAHFAPHRRVIRLDLRGHGAVEWFLTAGAQRDGADPVG